MKYILKKKGDIKYFTTPHLEKVQKLQFQMLEIVDRIAVENGIPYWLDGGTLLGAVRHKGIIPWDDDIDICLLKSDYDKLIPLLKEFTRNNSDYGLMFHEEGVLHWAEYFINKKAYTIEKGIKKPVRIDILPVKLVMDTDEDKNNDKYMVDIGNYFVFGKTKYFPEIKEKYKYSSLSEALKLKGEFLDFFVNDYLNKNLDSKQRDNFLVNYPYNDINIAREREYYKYTNIFPLSKVELENRTFPAPDNIDSYLKVLYGNYHDLPPLSSRKPYGSKYVFQNKSSEDVNKKYVRHYYHYFYFANKKYFKLLTLLRQVKSDGVREAYESIVKPFAKRGFKFK